jgi:hypothetical protein
VRAWGGGVGEYRLPPVAGGSSTAPPDVVFQALWIFEQVGLGFAWPDGDLARVAGVRDAAIALGAVVDEVRRDVADHAERVTGSGFGNATEAFGAASRIVHGEGGQLADLRQRCEQLAAYCLQIGSILTALSRLDRRG